MVDPLTGKSFNYFLVEETEHTRVLRARGGYIHYSVIIVTSGFATTHVVVSVRHPITY